MLQFVLASASPARRQLLQSVGINPLTYPSHFDESQIQFAEPERLVQALAQRKAEVVAAQLSQPSIVLGCDSVLYVAGAIHGKPRDAAEAIARWQVMRGGSGELLTGHALIDTQQQQTLARVQTTRVDFANLSDAEIAAYVSTGEPLSCAGCFALDGKGGLFVEKITGCHSNVIGLSLPLLRHMLQDLGYAVTDFW
jgi:septum formation protein